MAIVQDEVSLVQVSNGKPTGVVSQPTVPADPYDGMLWQNTGDSNYIIGATYSWNGTMWNLYLFMAENILVNTLNAITTNTGALNVTGDLTMATDNTVIKGSYDYGDALGGAFNARWFEGRFSLGRRFNSYLGDVFNLNSSGGKGSFMHYAESYYGLDYFKLRQYVSSTDKTLLFRTDVDASGISMGTTFGTENVAISPDLGGYIKTGTLNTKTVNVSETVTTNDLTMNGIGRFYGQLMAGNIDADTNRTQLSINYNRDLGRILLSKDDTGRYVLSDTIYERTYSSQPAVCITPAGTLGRLTSASKYKLNISEISNLYEKGIGLLTINPRRWNDKTETESLANALTTGESETVDNVKLTQYNGLIAEDLSAAGLDDFLFRNDSGEVEGIEYDKLWTLLIPVIRSQQKYIAEQNAINQRLFSKLGELKNE
ncbi:hypothetical protein [Enterococcus sp.]|uniref:hypothetical protein n=1 Tax=Enterococcus sp. TaxID=35783 RepID=UPI0028A15627|nr:hypothetical protein [Enterococcus sp.]